MFEAALLGAIQALTEFLPVSSSGHLRLGHAWLDMDAQAFGLLFDIVLHVGTLVAVLLVYRGRVGTLLAGVARGVADLKSGGRAALERHEGLRYLVLLVLATLPTGVIGLLLNDFVDSDLFGVRVVGALLMVNGVTLIVSKRFGEGSEDRPSDGPLSIGGIGPREALIIGIAQGVAVLPGISRAGTTIVVALALGVHRMKAAEFSFFLSIPAILGAVVLKMDVETITQSSESVGIYAVGALVSAVGGVLALTLLLGVVRNARLHQFAWYCWALGLAALLLGG